MVDAGAIDVSGCVFIGVVGDIRYWGVSDIDSIRVGNDCGLNDLFILAKSYCDIDVITLCVSSTEKSNDKGKYMGAASLPGCFPLLSSPVPSALKKALFAMTFASSALLIFARSVI